MKLFNILRVGLVLAACQFQSGQTAPAPLNEDPHNITESVSLSTDVATNASLSTDAARFVTGGTCYCDQSCTRYAFTIGGQVQNNKCFNFPTGYASISLDDGSYWCALYNEANCEGSTIAVGGVEYPPLCRTSSIGWIYSALCFF